MTDIAEPLNRRGRARGPGAGAERRCAVHAGRAGSAQGRDPGRVGDDNFFFKKKKKKITVAAPMPPPPTPISMPPAQINIGALAQILQSLRPLIPVSGGAGTILSRSTRRSAARPWSA